MKTSVKIPPAQNFFLSARADLPAAPVPEAPQPSQSCCPHVTEPKYPVLEKRAFLTVLANLPCIKTSLPIPWAQSFLRWPGQGRNPNPALFVSHTVVPCFPTKWSHAGNTGVRTQVSSVPTSLRGEKHLPGCLGCERAKQPVHVLLPGCEGTEDKNLKQTSGTCRSSH